MKAKKSKLPTQQKHSASIHLQSSTHPLNEAKNVKNQSMKRIKSPSSLANSIHKNKSTSSFLDFVETRKKFKSTKSPCSPSPLAKSTSKQKLQVKRNPPKQMTKQSSVDNFQQRLPWGCNQSRLKNYVFQTLSKMNKLRNSRKYQRTEQKEQMIQISHEKKLKTAITPQKMRIISPNKNKDRSEKSRNQEKTSKKESAFSSEGKGKSEKFSKQIRSSFSRTFQKIQENNLFNVKFRVSHHSILELQVQILKKAEKVQINLKKGSLSCQSISQQYQNLMPKQVIRLMSPVHNINSNCFAYPELHVLINQKNGTFSYQKSPKIPFSWLHLIEKLSPTEIKGFKSSKMKNRVEIGDGMKKKHHVETLLNIFNENYVKALKHKGYEYKFGFSYMKNVYIIRYHDKGEKYSMECEMEGKGDTSEVLKYFDFILNF